MRLIDADEIKYEVHEKLGLGIDYSINESDVSYVVYKHQIDSMPTIDPVKRGRWVKAEPDGCWSYSEVYKQCSECGKVTFLAEKMNYCPNCGAKMDEVTKDE